MSEEFEIRGPSVSGAPVMTLSNAPEPMDSKDESIEDVGIRPPTVSDDLPVGSSASKVIAPFVGAAGTVAGAGAGHFIGKNIAAEQAKTMSVLTKIDELVRAGNVDQARSLAEAAFGNKPLTFTPPPPELSAGEKWAGKITSHVAPGKKSVVDQAQAWQMAKGKGPVLKEFHKMVPPAAPGEPMGAFERMLYRAKKAEEVAEAAALTQEKDLEEIRKLASKAQVTSGLEAGEGVLGKIASISQRFPKTVGGVAGGLGAAGTFLSGVDAAESYRKNDIPMFVMNALQSVGSLLGTYPPTMLPGLGLTAAGGLGGYMIGKSREKSNLPQPNMADITAP